MYSVKFEDALSTTGFGKYNFVMLFLNIILIMGVAFETTSVAYLVPASACELHTTNFQQGLIAGIPLLGMTTSAHLGGYLADTRGRRKTLIWSLCLGFLFGILSSLSPDWIVFSVLKFCSSCALSPCYGLALTLLSECTPQYRRATMVALSSATFVSWVGVMAVLCIPILHLNFVYHIPYLNIDFRAWRLLAILYASPCALGAIVMYFSNESPRYLLSVGEEKKALEILRRIYSINTNKKYDEYKVSSLVLGEDTGKPLTGLWSSMVSQTVPLFKPPLLKNTLLLFVVYFIFFFGTYPFLIWMPFTADSVVKSLENGKGNLSLCDMLSFGYTESLTETHDCSFNSFAMMSVLAITIIIVLLNVVLSIIVNFVGNKRMLIAIQLFSSIAGLCINLASTWILSSILLVIFMAGIINLGFLCTFSVEVFPTYVKAMGVVLTITMGRLGSVIGINILKHLLVYNCELAFYSYSGLIFVSGMISVVLTGATKK